MNPENDFWKKANAEKVQYIDQEQCDLALEGLLLAIRKNITIIKRTPRLETLMTLNKRRIGRLEKTLSGKRAKKRKMDGALQRWEQASTKATAPKKQEAYQEKMREMNEEISQIIHERSIIAQEIKGRSAAMDIYQLQLDKPQQVIEECMANIAFLRTQLQIQVEDVQSFGYTITEEQETEIRKLLTLKPVIETKTEEETEQVRSILQRCRERLIHVMEEVVESGKKYIKEQEPPNGRFVLDFA